MNRTMITATNTLNQLQKQLDIIGHNLANVDTNGYKRRESNFTELLVQQMNNQLNPARDLPRLTPRGIRMGVGAKLAQSQMVTTQGSLQETNRPLDFALTNENQFFKVLVQENGEGQIRYTRDGGFYVTPVNDREVMLVNAQGFPLLDEQNQFITFSSQSKEIQLQSGGVLDTGDGQFINLGIVMVDHPQYLEQKGGNLLGMPNNPPIPETEILRELTGIERQEISLQQGSLEKSNVDVAKEMTDMMNVQRSYQFQSRSITLADQMLGLVNGLR
ncbi:flagellar basal-body rod protein FlgG [Oikeobacillus pervagus]|uniref:Flagellar basal-body rod protein FlgG n=1 Tax=Oikeobacillus pervagus TaxID=1325931 RepID=A0AAJ1SWG8_9BACI|nr:flagellar hook-basal body protein [Oikeobacillus pervagus]MDQ0214118.1 flagellar basal-body rod protein FlgG [Oikeobacillus pervagus]